jgi:hypothetical protein
MTPLSSPLLPCLIAMSLALAADDRREAKVGMPARIDQIVLPGTELEAKPLGDRKAPIVLRVIEVYPHGTDFRYDLVYYGLEPGRFDLRDYLQRIDRSSTAGLPAIPVEIKGTLPPGQVLPHPLEPAPGAAHGGYAILLWVAGGAWVGGLLGILLLRRRKKQADDIAVGPLSLAERLRPLIEEAMAGTLTQGQRADLERMLLALWRRKLRLGDMKPAAAFAVLRQHPEAGPLLRQLENWLHRPGPLEQVDLTELLRPYRSLPADADTAEELQEVKTR